MKLKPSRQNRNIWWAVTKHKPEGCPTCKTNMKYIGFAEQYSSTHTAHLYHCTQCETWVDCLQPRPLRRGHQQLAST